ncbi:MAG: site-specific integrase [Chthoniobacterales bacterium]
MNTKKPKFPLVVRNGSSVVKIYRDEKPQGVYFRVVYHLGGKRQRHNFADLQKAIDEAGKKAALLARGEMDVLQLTGGDRRIYGTALEAVKKFDVRLDAVALEYAEARALLDGVSLKDAASFYARHHARGLTCKTVAAAVDEMIEAKKRKGVSALYLADLRYRLGVFKESFHCDVSALAPDDLSKFFDALRLSPRSFNNFLRALRTFFAFAKKQDWLSKEADLLARVENRKERSAPVEIFTAVQLAALLEHSPVHLQPCIALAAFAGVRAEEILRLDWSDIERCPGFVEVAAHKAKTASRRIVPISDNLAKWLAIAPRTEGRIWPLSKAWFFQSIRETAAAAKVAWKQNALRHSFVSYRLAQVKDQNLVALEAGTSPKMINKHYRELATPEQARSWFAIAPNEATNVVPMRRGARES